ncbi:ASCH domain-containing protein [Sphingobacterium paludis]|uniref:ASCH domain-containing protein n=1 Tax=Sphingobacterium paludis TaxID=1476465 RepID=A0A4R7D6V3_9SPHI|nr:ASCH domain-containing protein [Sphingobacterium paludis]TDS14706.1 hypothetical protein B0I21_103201 [Sphingobacterium paludis]
MSKTQKTPVLIIKEVFFNQILSGEKIEEYRSLSDHYFKMFFDKNKDGEYEFRKPIDKIILAVGYHKSRKTAVVELKDIYIVEFQNVIPEGFEKGDECFVLELGKVLERNF